MKKNPVIPFALIATLGIVAMIVMGGVGLSQQDQAEGEGGNEGTLDPAELVEQNACISCHGEDLQGASGPSLNDVSERYSSVDELADIINNGVEGSSQMTGDYANGEEAQAIAEWLMNEQE
ncbi:c-type cytochrome [Aquisalibacillus elongatus]|uniref:Cytochrome c550 n=1 Tax=Aquisalibacillus elongatus TaxID=485577 RepID=A0A3N5BDU6_9BACI|nr:cytochrome c [Aquisalibacillus elongatus]RPF55607.1 cytochrome c550 [Aquisalibacillus elongatus]